MEETRGTPIEYQRRDKSFFITRRCMPKQACEALGYQNRQFNGWSKEGKPLAQCTLNDRVSRFYRLKVYKLSIDSSLSLSMLLR